MLKTNKKNKGIFILGVIFLFVVVFLAFQLFFRDKFCPSEYYINAMPQICPDSGCEVRNNNYYYKNGIKLDSSQYNQYFVEYVCLITPKILF